MILPDIDAMESAPFWEAARAHQLAVQRCIECGRFRFPPHRYCGWCRSDGSEWVRVSGAGHIWSFAEVHGPTLPHLEQLLPFPVIIVSLAEDPRIRMPGNVVTHPGASINSVPAASLSIGMQVQASFEDVSEGLSLPRWVLAGHG